MIRAVIFDFDGTLVDTETPWYQTLCEIYEEHGSKYTYEMWGRAVGTKGSDLYSELERFVGKAVNRSELDSRRRVRHAELMAKSGLRPGALAYLRDAKDRGLKIGLASSSQRSWVDQYLERFGIQDYFCSILTGDDVHHVKPHPELYMKSLELLGVQPNEALSFEDSPNGARAAESANISCVVVPNESTEKLSFGAYRLRLSSMSEMDLGVVLRIIDERRPPH